MRKQIRLSDDGTGNADAQPAVLTGVETKKLRSTLEGLTKSIADATVINDESKGEEIKGVGSEIKTALSCSVALAENLAAEIELAISTNDGTFDISGKMTAVKGLKDKLKKERDLMRKSIDVAVAMKEM